jgi:hypothetical protein
LVLVVQAGLQMLMGLALNLPLLFLLAAVKVMA